MGKRIDLLGQKFGCLTVEHKAKSLVDDKGRVFGLWEVRCDCGLLSIKRASNIMNRAHYICGSSCNLKSTCKVKVNCDKCGCEYEVQRRSLVHKVRSCRRCAALNGSSAVKGKPAHNRLPDDVGSFNNLYSRYRSSANLRGIPFNLSKEEFRVLTKGNCHFCGIEPSTKAPTPNKTSRADVYIYNGIDRVDNTKGYEAGNMVSCCGYCNKMKGPLPLDKFFNLVSNIYKRHLSPA